MNQMNILRDMYFQKLQLCLSIFTKGAALGFYAKKSFKRIQQKESGGRTLNRLLESICIVINNKHMRNHMIIHPSQSWKNRPSLHYEKSLPLLYSNQTVVMHEGVPFPKTHLTCLMSEQNSALNSVFCVTSRNTEGRKKSVYINMNFFFE